MNFIEMLRLNLQFFSQDDTGGSNPSDDHQDSKDDDTQDDQADDKKDDKKKDDEPTFTQAQVNKMIQERVNRLERDKQDAVKEAEKLAKMNADQKREYELEKAQKENEDLKAKLNRYELGKVATSILSESGITASDEILDLVVREDAEKTSEAVKAFSDLVDRISDEKMKEKLKGKSPTRQTDQTSTMTKAEIMQIQDTEKRQRLIKENIHLFQ